MLQLNVTAKACFRRRGFHVPNLIILWVDSNVFSTATDLYGEPNESHQMPPCVSVNLMTSGFSLSRAPARRQGKIRWRSYQGRIG